jgi:hypothetical protein
MLEPENWLEPHSRRTRARFETLALDRQPVTESNQD